jgi:hypothetical protein
MTIILGQINWCTQTITFMIKKTLNIDLWNFAKIKSDQKNINKIYRSA